MMPNDAHISSRIMASVTVASIEMTLFLPFDTMSKRIMVSKQHAWNSGESLIKTAQNTRNIVFSPEYVKKDSRWPSSVRNVMSLYQGAGFAYAYRLQQRLFYYTVQPVVTAQIGNHLGPACKSMLGDRNGTALMHGLAGSAVGFGEGLLTPLDMLKIKRQTNPGAFEGQSLWATLRQQNIVSLYQGAHWMMMRNVLAAGAMFGTISLVKSHAFGQFEKGSVHQNAKAWQNAIAALLGGTMAMIVGNPVDVVKTRVQHQSFGANLGGIAVARNLIIHEGWLSFYKGLGMKLGVIVPRITFTYTVATGLTQFFENKRQSLV